MWAYQNFFCFAKTFTNLFRKKLYQKPLETERRKHRIYISPIENKTSGFYFDLRSHASNGIKSKEPNLSSVKSAAEIVGRNLKRGAIIVLESTVYPGVTEEVVAPILEKESGLKCGIDFKIGYSPERINPGDEAHTLDKITKIAAGMDEKTTENLAELYGLITTVYKAKGIRTAEAAKV